jgi:hypothetical protein
MQIAIDQADISLTSDDLKKSLINAYLRCAVELGNGTHYLVDIYRAARFFFLSAFTAIVLLFSINFLFRSPDNQAKAIAHELRSDDAFIKLVHGEKGERGEPGQRGENDGTNNWLDTTNTPWLAGASNIVTLPLAPGTTNQFYRTR